MGYSKEVFEEALRTLEQRRSAAAARADALRARMRAATPRVREIETEMARASLLVSRAILDGGDVEQAVTRIRDQNLALQAELAQLLAEHGEQARNFEPQYTCPVCGDTGYDGREMCVCLRTLLQEGACRRLSSISHMQFTTFDELQLDYYPDEPDASGQSPRRQMRDILAYCRGYAEDFSPASPSLLLRGPTGTGKTHVSLAITRLVAARGFHAIYGPTQQLLHQLEKEHFGRADGNSEDMMTECDLLVLDDLGAEFPSPFYTSCLYNLINTRMLAGFPTIISTNLSARQLTERYGEQISSRIIGTFQPLTFAGRDVRQLKLQERIRG